MIERTKTSLSKLPERLPIFPLAGVLLLPGGGLPLNIFEPRYLAMVDDALRDGRMIGMIQPREDESLYPVGCAGRITSFSETGDGRYLITLTGLCRFHLCDDAPLVADGYRRGRVDWSGFAHDLDPGTELHLDRGRLCGLLRSYFEMEGMQCDWAAVEGTSDDRLMTCLAMACPLEAGEKQALLEAACPKTRTDLFLTLLEMAVRRPARPCPEKGNCCH